MDDKQLLLDELRQEFEKIHTDTDYFHRAINSLTVAISQSPNDPRLFFYRGLAYELSSSSVAGLPNEAVEDYLYAYNVYGGYLQEQASSARAYANQCIVLDRLRNGKELKKLLTNIPQNLEDSSYEFWFSLGTLYHKVGLYTDAISCLKRALIAKPADVDATLKMAYCLEGLVKLWEAVDCFQSVLALSTVGPLKNQNKDAYAEACHGLGHVYTELGDREQGRRYMKSARDISPVYMCCYAAIHSELKDYQAALDLLEEALKHPYYQANDEGRHELLFYCGEAYSGLQMFTEADRAYRKFEEFSVNRGDTDAVAHVAIFQVKSYLKRSSLNDLSIEELESYLRKLESCPLSAYANVFIHEEYNKLIEILESYIEIKRSLLHPELGTRIPDAIERLKSVLELGEKLPVLYLSDLAAPYLEDSLLDFRSMEDSQVCDVWLFTIRHEVPTDYLVLIAKNVEEKTIIVANEGGLSFPDSLREDVVVLDSMGESIQLAKLILLLDHSRKYIAEVKPIYAMAPVRTAPSFVSAQAGDVYPLELPMHNRQTETRHPAN